MATLSREVAVVTLSLTLALGLGCQDVGTSVDDQIKGSEGLSRMDALCESLKVPPSFSLAGKRTRGNNRVYDVGYEFKSSLDFPAVRMFFRSELSLNGWVYDQDLSYPDHEYISYRKGNQLIVISKVGGGANYVIQCDEEH